MKPLKSLLLTGLLLQSLALQAQSELQFDATITHSQTQGLVKPPPQRDPLVTHHSATQAGIYKSGIIFIADQIERNVKPEEKKLSTVVTSFTSLDDLAETSPFGRLLGEHLMHELMVRGWTVNDIRLSRELLINSSGELSLSRDLKRLRGTVPAANVLTGTYTVTADGVLVSARLLDFNTGQLISSAETRFAMNPFISSVLARPPRPVPIIKLNN